MQIRAEQKNTRQSPRKVRLIANQVKDMSLEKAFVQLALMDRRASLVLIKVLRQAVANAANNHNLDVKDLEIDKILVKTGPTYKRMRPVSRGRAHSIFKRTCHVEVVLKTKKDAQPLTKKSTTKVKTSEKSTKKNIKKTTVKKVKKSQQKQQPDVKLKDTSKVTKQLKQDPATAKIHRRKTGSSK